MNTCAVVPSLVVPKGLLTKHPLPAIELAVAPSRSMGINILRIGKNLKCPVQGNGRVYVVSEAAALRQFLCFLPVLGRWQGSLHAVQTQPRSYRQPRDETSFRFQSLHFHFFFVSWKGVVL